MECDAPTFGFVTKADARFFDGLLALLASIQVWHPDQPITVVDCGLSAAQMHALAGFARVSVICGTGAGFKIPRSMQHYYTPAVYGFFSAHEQLYPVTIHVDADAVVLGPLDRLAAIAARSEPGICAVPDYPHLTLAYQLGDLPGAHASLLGAVPEVRLDSMSFNGGVFAIRAQYYNAHMRPFIDRLLPYHELFWGNDMAVLNFAAYGANPRHPFIDAGNAYNTRHHYRRASHLAPNRIAGLHPNGMPRLEGPFGPVHILHFVGQDKPWYAEPTPSDSLTVWQTYRQLARTRSGL